MSKGLSGCLQFLNPKKKNCCKDSSCCETVRVCVTGAAGQICYSLIPMIASGYMFGNKKLIITLLDIPVMIPKLKGFIMELHDSSYPNVVKYIPTGDPKEGFKDADFCILVGAVPRKKGMTRGDLLKLNGGIFQKQGKIINEVAKPTCKIVVVGNPSNTNALILSKQFTNIPKTNVTCLTRLDVNRAKSQIALKCGVLSSQVKDTISWGNHSASQWPDVTFGFVETKDGKKTIKEMVNDDDWLKNEFAKCVATRGKAIIEARGFSSATSAAKAICDHMRNWVFGSDEIISMGVLTDGKDYNIAEGVICSLPLKCKGEGKWEVVKGLKLTDLTKEKLDISVKELLSERETAFKILNIK